MRTHKKPDLLFILIVFVGFGVLVSSYIQYSRANPTASVETAQSANQTVSQQETPSNPLILVANPVHTATQNHDNNGVLVNKSSKQP